MEFRRRKRFVGEIYTASLNDIMFFLLLFFLIASTMATPTVLKLLLPNSKSGIQNVKNPITIAVSADLQYAINNTVITPDQMEPMLRTMIVGQIDPAALVKVDKSIQVQNLVELLDIGTRLKIKMVLAVETKSK